MSEDTYSNGNHILVGLGGTGGKILRAFKMRMFEEFPDSEERKRHPVALLYVDSTMEMMSQDGRARSDFKVMGQDASFTQNEFLYIKDVDVEHLLDHIDNYPTVKGIVNNVSAIKSAIGSLGKAAGQKRRAGRLLFAANAVGFVNSLRDAYSRAEQISGDASKTTFHIFAGLAGGTGSGAIIDAMIQTRKAFPDAKILVYAMIPEMNLPKSDMDQGRYYQNGYAAVKEINALQAGRWFPHDVTGYGPAKFYNDRVKGVADGVSFYSNVNENGVTTNSLTELPKIVSDYVFSRIFIVNEGSEVNSGIIRAFNFENMDDFALEYDEIGNPDTNGRIPVARTKKLNSFGIKRVMYPELRILKHITYTIGQNVLWQFKYNNWRENQGFVNEERNRDLRHEYLNKDKLAKWMLDSEHLTLNKKILANDAVYPTFADYWKNRVQDRADEARAEECPLSKLDTLMTQFFDELFRDEGVVAYFSGKERVIPEMAKELRRNVESELFDKWKNGDISITELKKISSLLIEEIGEKRKEIDDLLKKEKETLKDVEDDRDNNEQDWSHLGVLQRMVNKGARLYQDHQGILIDYYVCKTKIVALEFAQKLVAKTFNEISKMDTDISTFGKKIEEALKETEALISAQRKLNKGLEDMKGAIIEVSEEEQMANFETELKCDKVEMPNIARIIREHILPHGDFVNFGLLAEDISVDEICDAFDTQLSKIVKIKHDERSEIDLKVLGLNILTQLQQKLRTDDDIKAFATNVVRQSGVYLKLNPDQVQLHLRNNEGTLSPTNPASINKKAILVSIPSPKGDPHLVKFADKLEYAFKNSFNQSIARTDITVNRESSREDELSIITVNYCYPVRAIDWLKSYKTRYDQFLNTGNPATDAANAILIHSEGDGKDMPSVFPVENAEEVARMAREANTDFTHNVFGVNVTTDAPIMPPMPGAVPPVATPQQKPNVSVHLAVGGQQYGPYTYDQCEKMTKTGQLTADTYVWMAGMQSWQPASKVAELSQLFAPCMPNGMPPIPGANPAMPPMPPVL